MLLFLRQRETFPGMPSHISRRLAQNTSYFASIKVHFIPKTGIKAFSKVLLRLMPVLLLETVKKACPRQGEVARIGSLAGRMSEVSPAQTAGHRTLLLDLYVLP